MSLDVKTVSKPSQDHQPPSPTQRKPRGYDSIDSSAILVPGVEPRLDPSQTFITMGVLKQRANDEKTGKVANPFLLNK
ncbi:MAG: hypothetical protein K940chlam8_01076 [Chlamydiae bacterium]|nr:hypothetical protein [Chlamydiota bacterium]